MTMKIQNIIAGTALFMSAALSATSASATIIHTIEAENVFSSTQSNVTVIDFESDVSSMISGDYTIYGTPSGTGQSAPPYGSELGNHYLSVPNPTRSGSATITLGASNNYFGMFWGSVDTYNSLHFYNGTDLVGSYTGTQLHEDLIAHGGQADWASNRYVNFFFTEGLSYDSYVLTSTNYAFETDNHAYGTVSVPEPASFALLGLGMFALVWARRKVR